MAKRQDLKLHNQNGLCCQRCPYWVRKRHCWASLLQGKSVVIHLHERLFNVTLMRRYKDIRWDSSFQPFNASCSAEHQCSVSALRGTCLRTPLCEDIRRPLSAGIRTYDFLITSRMSLTIEHLSAMTRCLFFSSSSLSGSFQINFHSHNFCPYDGFLIGALTTSETHRRLKLMQHTKGLGRGHTNY